MGVHHYHESHGRLGHWIRLWFPNLSKLRRNKRTRLFGSRESLGKNQKLKGGQRGREATTNNVCLITQAKKMHEPFGYLPVCLDCREESSCLSAMLCSRLVGESIFCFPHCFPTFIYTNVISQITRCHVSL